jgi:exosome complex exonuclease DIS3/RRP44
MKTSKSFVKKTKKGAILKVVREHYLRDDVWTCWKGDERISMEKPIINKDALQSAPSSRIFPFEHLIVPDTNVVLHQVSK